MAGKENAGGVAAPAGVRLSSPNGPLERSASAAELPAGMSRAAAWLVDRHGVTPVLAPLVAELAGLGGSALQ
ncbi:MAG: hypothetical protein H6851_09720 [Geminicoccaceae bacterium]|nr:hypothetical protein [Geminicoccaceae bacterium]